MLSLINDVLCDRERRACHVMSLSIVVPPCDLYYYTPTSKARVCGSNNHRLVNILQVNLAPNDVSLLLETGP